MSDWFDKEMKRLSKKFNEIFQRIMTPPGKRDLEPDKDFKMFEKKGPGFHMKVGIFNLTMGSKDFDSATISEFGEDKKVKVVEEEEGEEEPRKLALRRFKERKKEDEE